MARATGTRPATERMKRKQAATRTAIISAAVELFSQEPYRDVTIAKIMERAGYSVGTYYSFFDDKEDLITSATKELISEANSFMKEIPGDLGWADRIMFVMHGAACVIAEHQILFNLFVVTLAENPASFGDKPSGHAAGSIAMLAELVAAGQQDGAFRTDVDPAMVASMLQANLQVTARQKKSAVLVADIDAKTAFILEGLKA